MSSSKRPDLNEIEKVVEANPAREWITLSAEAVKKWISYTRQLEEQSAPPPWTA